MIARRYAGVGAVWAAACTAGNSARDTNPGEGLPLSPTRSIEFSTTEATWMSLDISPDGKTIVFDVLGDLYTLPIVGGVAKQLTSGLAWDHQPRFSPDGQRIAFASDRSGGDELWVVRIDGTGLRQVTKQNGRSGDSPRWTADGSTLLALTASTGGRGLRLYDVENGSSTDIAALAPVPGTVSRAKEEEEILGAALSPNGKTLYYISRLGYQYGNPAFQSSLTSLELSSGKVLSATPLVTPDNSAFSPIIAPNGRWLVYGSGVIDATTLRVRDLTTGRDTVLATHVQRVTTTGDGFPGYAFTPDSRAVVYTADGKLQRVEIESGRVADIPFRIDAKVELAPLGHTNHRIDDGPITVRGIREVTQSPDGRRLAFSAVGRVWVMEVGGRPRLLGSQSTQPFARGPREYEPTFSPDGRWIAFATWDAETGGRVWKAPAAGGQAVAITSPDSLARAYARLRWTPDGARIVFQTLPVQKYLDGEVMDLHARDVPLGWVDASGGAVHLLSQKVREDPKLKLGTGAISLSRDGTRLYFVEFANPFLVKSLSIPDKRGTSPPDVRIYARIDGNDVQAAVPSPDEKWIAIEDRLNIYVVPLTRVANGDSVPLISLNGHPRDSAIIQLTAEGGIAPSWSPDGEWLNWSFANRFYRIRVSDLANMRGRAKPEEIVIDLSVPRPLPTGSVLLRGARIVTMAETGIKRTRTTAGETVATDPMVIERGDLLISGRRIAGVGATGSLEVPAGTDTIDVTGATIIPGLIAQHIHTLNLKFTGEPPPYYSAALAWGITSYRSPGDRAIGSAELVEAGAIPGPRLFAGSEFLTPEGEPLADQEAAHHVARKYGSLNVAVLKPYGRGRRDERQWLSIAARTAGIKATTDLTLWNDKISAALDGFTGIEHVFYGTGPSILYRDVVELLARSGTTWDPTFASSEFTNMYRDSVDSRRQADFLPPAFKWMPLSKEWMRIFADRERESTRSARDVLRAGGNVTIGPHEYPRPGAWHMTHAEMLTLTEGGMTNAEALRCATLNGARALGVEGDLGSIETGKIADLVILNSNPLDHLRSATDLRYVVKDGEVFDGRTLNTLWPTARKFPPMRWQTRSLDRQTR